MKSVKNTKYICTPSAVVEPAAFGKIRFRAKINGKWYQRTCWPTVMELAEQECQKTGMTFEQWCVFHVRFFVERKSKAQTEEKPQTVPINLNEGGEAGAEPVIFDCPVEQFYDLQEKAEQCGVTIEYLVLRCIDAGFERAKEKLMARKLADSPEFKEVWAKRGQLYGFLRRAEKPVRRGGWYCTWFVNAGSGPKVLRPDTRWYLEAGGTAPTLN